ncbi:hypothetical protein QFC21_006699 [Naganishia friedmannii]|uniref:Uncharacterized protein n=1 Tax=Naganishia friedmannii TaxID=89922 RepID=A0ACC2V154_9TREE|nr:hypothetical protein QFC21_006699 [Naganishia friedmannii]
MSEVKAQLAALAARQSGGKTSDPAALSVPSTINARVPSVPDIDTSKTPAGTAKKGKAKGKAASAKQMKRAERAKERAEELGGQLEKKLREKEGRKLSSTKELFPSKSAMKNRNQMPGELVHSHAAKCV